MRIRQAKWQLLAITLMLATLTPGCANAESKAMTPERWREDLRYMEKQLVKKHAEPFENIDEATWRAAVNDLYDRIPTLNDAAIQVEMGRLVAMLGDGHTELWLAREGLGFRNLPLFLYDYGGEIYVYIVSDGWQELLGARVVAVEGAPIADVVAAVDPLIARDNAVEPLLSIPVYIGISEILYGLGLTASPDVATFTFELDGRAFDKRLPALSDEEANATEWIHASDRSPTPLYLQHRDRYYWYDYDGDTRTMYLKYNRCADQKGEPSIKKFSKDLFKAFDEHDIDRMIVDVRNNRGGNYNKSKPLIEGIAKRTDRLGEGKLFVITGRETFSAGMVTALQLKQRTGAVLVGEPGRSSPNGCENYEWFHLPNSNIRVDYTNRVTVRAPEYAGSDVLPVDIRVANDFADYRDGRDRVLEAILEL